MPHPLTDSIEALDAARRGLRSAESLLQVYYRDPLPEEIGRDEDVADILEQAQATMASVLLVLRIRNLEEDD